MTQKINEPLDDAITWRAIYEPRNMLRELLNRAYERTRMKEGQDGMELPPITRKIDGWGGNS